MHVHVHMHDMRPSRSTPNDPNPNNPNANPNDPNPNPNPNPNSLKVDAKLPRLAKHLRQHCVQSELYATRWFVGIFANTLPIESVLRVWDVFLFEGAKILHRVGISLL